VRKAGLILPPLREEVEVVVLLQKEERILVPFRQKNVLLREEVEKVPLQEEKRVLLFRRENVLLREEVERIPL